MSILSEHDELPSFRLDGRIAVITGASEGIGRAFAIAYARAGAEVILVSRRREKLLEVQQFIRGVNCTAHIICADLGKLDEIQSLSHGVRDLIVGKDSSLVLINNAGFAFTKPAFDVTEADWDRVLDLHVKGTFFCSQFIGRLMIERKYGKIINLSSTWSASTDIGKSVYGIAKASVKYMTSALSTEWASSGIRVNAIAPCATLSHNTRLHMQQNPDRTQRLLSKIKLNRFPEPSDLVGAAIFMGSAASDFITGETLFVDGGWHAAR